MMLPEKLLETCRKRAREKLGESEDSDVFNRESDEEQQRLRRLRRKPLKLREQQQARTVRTSRSRRAERSLSKKSPAPRDSVSSQDMESPGEKYKRKLLELEEPASPKEILKAARKYVEA